MASDPILLFVVGAAKAGTSWLYRYLRNHPDCHLRSIKELHFFDAKTEEALVARRPKLERRLETLEARFLEAEAGGLAETGTEIADINAWLAVLATEGDRTAAYLDYLAEGRDKETVIGEITPAYALLPEEELRRMAGLSHDVRFIYIMRDPVERLWSHVRMAVSRKQSSRDLDPQIVRRFLWRVYRGEEPDIVERGDYRAAVGRLSHAVAPEKVLLAFTEEMLSPSGMHRICDFLEIPYVEPELDRRVHEGAALPAQERQRKAMAEFLAPQYDFIEQLFGRLPKAWQREPLKV